VTRPSARYVALIRGINVGATRKLPMAELRAACGEAGFEGVATYIQSGNLVLTSDLSPDAVAKRLETLIAGRFGLEVPVIVRTAAEWRRHAAGSPFPDAEVERPRLLHICPSAAPARPEAVAMLEARASAKERIAIRDGTLWIDFGESVGTSKLTPALLDRAAGSPVTARNWNTVLKLAEMAAA
jgi:uncharacterized protein (DUF1697 family)